MTKKHAGGRPTEYRGEATCAAVLAFASTMTADNFDERCTVDCVGVHLGITGETVRQWGKAHPEFSAALKTWETRRNAVAMKFRRWSDARWIFCMKNWTDMADKQTVETSGTYRIVYGGATK